ncbi:unnamed protein product [Notodromas monacha]|uniref:Uncharacterized protein n=1 Tax=Notodromas monacha TaxID=399045 RepID=A0A7R9BST5_9CRUS|nr:unnamed protein product [Notodromas monacha]CAG0920752.1 unnamed protein product [Notodromas monacha]
MKRIQFPMDFKFVILLGFVCGMTGIRAGVLSRRTMRSFTGTKATNFPSAVLQTDRAIEVLRRVSNGAKAVELVDIYYEKQTNVVEAEQDQWIGVFNTVPSGKFEEVPFKGHLLAHLNKSDDSEIIQRVEVASQCIRIRTGIQVPMTNETLAKMAKEKCRGVWVASFSGKEPLLNAVNCLKWQPEWMASMSDLIGNISLADLFIPGRTGSSTQLRQSSIKFDLAHGIRYFELNIKYGPHLGSKKDFYLAGESGEVSGNLGDHIAEIRQFMNETEEILMINFVHFFGFTSQGIHDEFVTFLQENLGAWMSPKAFEPSAPLNLFWATDKRLIVMYNHLHTVHKTEFLWNPPNSELPGSIGLREEFSLLALSQEVLKVNCFLSSPNVTLLFRNNIVAVEDPVGTIVVDASIRVNYEKAINFRNSELYWNWIQTESLPKLREYTTASRANEQITKALSPTIYLAINPQADYKTAVDGQTIFIERKIELRWRGGSTYPTDEVALYLGHPASQNASLLVSYNVYDHINNRVVTEYQMPRYHFSADDPSAWTKPECLGNFYGAYLKGGEITSTNCLSTLPTWMEDNADAFEKLELRKMLIPGTHDAGAYREYDGLASDNLIVKYAITQEETLLSQLVHGVRFFDLRIGCYDTDSEFPFWINHDVLKINRFDVAMADLVSFVRNTNDVFFLDFHRFPVGFDSLDKHRRLMEFIVENLGDVMAPKSMGYNVTFGDMLTLGKKVIVAYNHKSLEHPLFWREIEVGWADANTVTELKSYMNSYIREEREKFWGLGLQLTPTELDVILDILGGLRNAADAVNPNVIQWLLDDWKDYETNIVSTDFFLSSVVTTWAVEENKRLAAASQ